MTIHKKRLHRFASNSLLKPHMLASSILIFFMLALILRNSEVAIGFMQHGLSLCASTVIPSLFPFMVISELLVESGAGELAGRLFARPMKRIFGISGSSACAILLGALCGFPIGARTAVALYDRGEIDQDEFTHLMTFCNNTSSAFLISAVGTSLWSSRAFGTGLYCIQLLAAALVGLIGRRRKETPAAIPPVSPSHSAHGISIFTHAISSSANGILIVCAYVTFFSSLVGALGVMLDQLSTSPVIDALLFGFFELSSGVSAAAALPNRAAGAILTGFIVGWSGLSVHFQIMALTDGRGLAHRRLFYAKFLQGLLCAGAVALWFFVAPPAIIHSPAHSMPTALLYPLPAAYLRSIQIFFGGAAAFSLISALFREVKQRKNMKKSRNLR